MCVYTVQRELRTEDQKPIYEMQKMSCITEPIIVILICFIK